MATTANLVVCKSVHHGNTWRVAVAVAEALQAEIVAPAELPYTVLERYELIGFGSGIYYGGFHPELGEWVRGLPPLAAPTCRAFLFSTSGLPWLWRLWHRTLRAELSRKGFDVVGEFHCRGFDTWGPLRSIGGINRGHPDRRDLARAAEFAREMLGKSAGPAVSLQRPPPPDARAAAG